MSLSLPRNEHGFTMVTLMGVMLIVVAMVFTTYSVADGDLAPGKNDEDRKVAYAAAEAGVQNYLFHLLSNDDYWSKCDEVTPPHAVNLGDRTLTNWLSVPGSGARYAIELMPANGRTACARGVTESMIDETTASMKIRATGEAPSGVRRSIVATLKRRSFLDYVWFTDHEDQDPVFYQRWASGAPTLENPRPPQAQRDIVQWAAETCAQTYYYNGRSTLPRFTGSAINNAGFFFANTWYDISVPCSAGNINFFGPSTPSDGDAPAGATEVDAINGPLHTNDELLICGNARFGRSPQDKIEVSGPGRPLAGAETAATVGWRGCDASSKPNVNFPGDAKSKLGTWLPNSPTLTLPPTNDKLHDDTSPAYRFVGRTVVQMAGDQIIVSGRREGTPQSAAFTRVTMPAPADGVLYVSNEACGAVYRPLPGAGEGFTHGYPTPPTPGTGCGDLELYGTYSRSMTMTAQNDIVIKGDLREDDATSVDALLGLISNNFIRIWHPVENVTNSGIDCDSVTDPAAWPEGADYPWPGMRIDAAMLSLAHSIVFDHFFCGENVGKGTLTTFGALGQKYRGFVSIAVSRGQTIVSGFKKDYIYDNRLKFRSPPKFIDPVAAGWQVQLYTEQVPARQDVPAGL